MKTLSDDKITDGVDGETRPVTLGGGKVKLYEPRMRPKRLQPTRARKAVAPRLTPRVRNSGR